MARDRPGHFANGDALTLDAARKKLNEETRFPEKLELRIGAQVMLIMVNHSILSSVLVLTGSRT